MNRGFPIASVLVLVGCSPSFNAIDEHVNTLLIEGSDQVAATVPPRPKVDWAAIDATEEEMNNKYPTTVNPPVGVMNWKTSDSVDAREVLERLIGYQDASEAGELLTLDDALTWAFANGREYQFAEEDYLLVCLQLVLELHLWTPQIADTISMQYEHEDGDNDFLQSASAVVNTFSASQRLPWGGEITAAYVATFAREVYGQASQNVAGTTENTRVGQFFFGGSIPLLRGAGMIAQEDLIQAERSLIYAARTFEQFRRDFWFRIVQSWFRLLIQRQQLDNALESTELLDKLAERQRALYEAGRARLYDAAEAENRALQEQSRVAGLQETYRLAVDRFKLLINVPIGKAMTIDAGTIVIDPPMLDLDAAVQIAMHQRLDLQTERNELVDRQRGVRNALNGLLPDLDLAGEIRFGANDTYYYDAVLPSAEDMNAEASLTLSLPLDRQNERIAVRKAQISLERGRRAYRRQRDAAAIEVRTSVRDIDANLFSLDIQRRNVEIARVNIESIDADPDTYTVLDQLSAIQSLQRAQNGRAEAFQKVQESILQYLITTGQMRIGAEANLKPIPGMVIGVTSTLSYQKHASASD